jgi:hypothetical protein
MGHPTSRAYVGDKKWSDGVSLPRRWPVVAVGPLAGMSGHPVPLERVHGQIWEYSFPLI